MPLPLISACWKTLFALEYFLSKKQNLRSGVTPFCFPIRNLTVLLFSCFLQYRVPVSVFFLISNVLVLLQVFVTYVQ